MTSDPTTDPLGVILAGGRASRMGGGDKALLPLAGVPMLDRVIERLGPQCAALALSANGDPARFAGYGLPVLADSMPDHPGPLAGVLAGLDWAAERGAASIVTAAADTPFFPTDLVARLQAAAGPGGLALAASRDADGRIRRQPTFGIWPVALRDDLRAALRQGLRKIVIWTDGHQAGQAVFEAEGFDPFFNVNTPADIEAAEALLKNR
ncbi:molybdenum cofactor guanylyltransferase MobA [Thalassovita mangrovi]|uniref:Molybdenum cofactor guanylyltransferase n=1 Tax=Thalassovita mangrovi TaxID=2692236 RepID=A0A6L8LIY3_9RHOB|nr:molybdenum cofactor guanylyltransferase MobA [Thalassovita mangrovi]MYM55987.1 molybdenum cofactor guanylyltransferase MobA [Thalassovita mangrovi]